MKARGMAHILWGFHHPSSVPPPSSVVRGCWWFGLLALLLLFTQHTLLATSEECLYFSNSNSRVSVVRSSENRTAELVDLVTILGYAPSGIAIANETVYVASVRQIEIFLVSDLTNDPTAAVVTTVLVDFAKYLSVFICPPQGIEVDRGFIYIACSQGFPYSIVQFEVETGDFVKGLNALQLSNIFDFTIADGGTDRAVLFFTDSSARTVYKLPLGSNPRTALQQNPVVWFWGTRFPNSTSTAWTGLEMGPNNEIFVVEFSLFSGMGLLRSQLSRILSYNLTTGSFLRIVSVINESTADSPNLCLNSLRDTMYILIPKLLSPSSVLRYYPDSSAQPETFYNGSLDDELFPQYCRTYACPIPHAPPEPDTEGSELSDTVIVVVVVFSILFVVVIGVSLIIMIMISSATVYGVNMYQGRRRVWEDLEAHGKEMSTMGAQNPQYSFREIDLQDLEFSELLGKGAYGKVYKGSWRGVTVAIKTLEVEGLDTNDNELLVVIREEANIMARLGNHPHVVTFLGAVTVPAERPKSLPESEQPSVSSSGSSGFLCLVLEYCPRGSLYDCIIRRREKIPFATLVRMFRDVANGLSHLHKEKVIHRDIAARNVLVGKNFDVFISDFGMARLRRADTNTTQSTVGPVAWMAPESLLRREYSEASDVFAFGVMLWEIMARREPWRGVDAAKIIIAVAKENTRLKIPDDCDPVISSIITACWKVRPEKRITMEQIRMKLNNYLEKLETLYADFVEVGPSEQSFESLTVPFLTASNDGGGLSRSSRASRSKKLEELRQRQLQRFHRDKDARSDSKGHSAAPTATTPNSSSPNVSNVSLSGAWEGTANMEAIVEWDLEDVENENENEEEGEGFQLRITKRDEEDMANPRIHYEDIVILDDADDVVDGTAAAKKKKKKQKKKKKDAGLRLHDASSDSKGKEKEKGKESDEGEEV